MQARAVLAAKADSRAEELGFSKVLREPALFVLSVLLLFSFSLFPRGYMPVRTTGGFTIVLCSAADLETRSVDADGANRPRQHIGSVNCDIAGAPAAAVLDAPVDLRFPLPALLPTLLWPISVIEIVFRSLFDPNAPPTAPPLLIL